MATGVTNTDGNENGLILNFVATNVILQIICNTAGGLLKRRVRWHRTWYPWEQIVDQSYAKEMLRIVERESESFSVAANANFGTEIAIPIPDGYKYVCILDVWSASMNVVSTNRWLDSGTSAEVKIKVNGRNISNQNVDVFRVHASILAQKI